MGEQPAGGVAGRDVRAHLGHEVVLVLLAVVHPRIGIAASHSGHVFAILALGFAPHGEGHSRRRHEVADIGRIDEHPAAIGLPAEHRDRRDPLAVHRHALAGSPVQLLAIDHFHARLREQLLEDLAADVRFEASDEILAVGLRDARVEILGDPAEGALLAQEIGRPEAAGAHAARKAGGVHQDDGTSLAFSGDGGRHRAGGITVDDDVMDDFGRLRETDEGLGASGQDQQGEGFHVGIFG